MKGFQPFFRATLQVPSEAPARVMHSQEGLSQPLTLPQPFFPSHYQVASFSSQGHKSNAEPHTLTSQTHSAPDMLQFPAMQQQIYHEVPRLTGVMINAEEQIGSSTSSLTSPHTEQFPTSMRFTAPKSTSSFSTWSSQIRIPSLVKPSCSQRQGYSTLVFRPWESD